MAQTSVKVDNETHWHKLRAQNVGASEVAGLFGLSNYVTKFTLWHRKAGNIASPDFDSERMKWGNRLEEAIAKGIAEDKGWDIRKVKRYITHPTIKGMGSSLDYEIRGNAEGMGSFEIKNVSLEAWKKDWVVHEDRSIEAPIYIELQLQHQLAVTGWNWGAIGLLVAGNESHLIIRQRHPETIARIEEAVSSFWETIEKNQEPALEDSADLIAAAQLFRGDKMLSLENEKFESLCKTFLGARQERQEAEEKESIAKSLLITYLGGMEAEIGIGKGFKATYKQQTKKAHMVSESTFRVLRVSEIKEKESHGK